MRRFLSAIMAVELGLTPTAATAHTISMREVLLRPTLATHTAGRPNDERLELNAPLAVRIVAAPTSKRTGDAWNSVLPTDAVAFVPPAKNSPIVAARTVSASDNAWSLFTKVNRGGVSSSDNQHTAAVENVERALGWRQPGERTAAVVPEATRNSPARRSFYHQSARGSAADRQTQDTPAASTLSHAPEWVRPVSTDARSIGNRISQGLKIAAKKLSWLATVLVLAAVLAGCGVGGTRSGGPGGHSSLGTTDPTIKNSVTGPASWVVEGSVKNPGDFLQTEWLYLGAVGTLNVSYYGHSGVTADIEVRDAGGTVFQKQERVSNGPDPVTMTYHVDAVHLPSAPFSADIKVDSNDNFTTTINPNTGRREPAVLPVKIVVTFTPD